MSVRPYKAPDNQITGVVMIFFNIDHIRNAEQLQQKLQHEQRLAAVVRDANDAVTVQDFTGHILAWNRRATEMYGYSEEEALQLNAAILIPDESREEMHRLLAQLEQGEKMPPCETLRRAKNGRLFKIWLTTSLLLNEAGNPSAIAITEREIT